MRSYFVNAKGQDCGPTGALCTGNTYSGLKDKGVEVVPIKNNKPVTPTKKVTRTPTPPDTKKPTWQEQSYTGGSSGKPNTYQGLKNMGFEVSGNGPVKILDYKIGNCQWWDLSCHFKNLKIPQEMMIPLAGGAFLILLLLLIRR